MKLMDRILGSMRFNLPDEEEYEEDEVLEEEAENALKRSALSFLKKESNGVEETAEEQELSVPSSDNKERTLRRMRSNRVVPMKQSNPGYTEVCMISPKDNDDANQIADLLLEGKTVVLNLESMNIDIAQRVIDFASGACYTLEGRMQKISKKIFIVTPSNVELTGDFVDTLGGTSVNLSTLNVNSNS